MELVKNTRVFFEPVSHNYLLDDETILPGVTTLLKKHGLSADYSGIPGLVLAKAAEEGTAIHKELEDYDNGETMLVSDLIDEYKKLGLRHLASEYLVSDNQIVATLIDKVYYVDESTVDIAEIKTTAKYHKRPVEWQLGLGKELFELQNPGKKVRNCFCIHVDKKTRHIIGLIPVEPVTAEEVRDLLSAELNGTTYEDIHAVVQAALALSEEELMQYTIGLERIAEAKDVIKQTEAIIKAYEARVLEYMQEHNLTELSSDGGTFKLKAAYERTSIDAAKLRKDYPNLADKYGKTTTVAASVTFKANNS